MSKYFCYKKLSDNPPKIKSMTLAQWIDAGKPTDETIHFVNIMFAYRLIGTHRDYYTFDRWVNEGKPTDAGITFLDKFGTLKQRKPPIDTSRR